MAKLTKSQILGKLAERTDVSKKTAALLIDELVKLAYKEAHNSFVIHGLGKLILSNRKARIVRNPATGEQFQIPATQVVKFHIAKKAKDSILGAK